MEEWDKQIQEFKIAAEKADPETQTKYHQKIDDMESQKLNLKKHLNELEESSGDTWRDISEILSKAAVDFKQTLERAAGYFKRGA